MARTELQEASDLLREASAEVDDEDLEERLYEQSNQMAQLATADRDPDHGRLARHLHALDDIKSEAGEKVREAIDDAKAKITEFRKTLEGV